MSKSTIFSRTIFALLFSASALIANASESTSPWANQSCSMPEYDRKMLRAEEKGVVKLRFSTDLNGNVVNAKIEESSGFTNLDRASMSALKSCRFEAENQSKKTDSNIPAEQLPSRVISFTWAIK